jgi:hypothetical protein
MSAVALCTWGMGPDVLVLVAKINTSGYPWVPSAPMDAVCDAGSFGLTVQESRMLAAQLITAADRAEALVEGLQEMIPKGVRE